MREIDREEEEEREEKASTSSNYLRTVATVQRDWLFILETSALTLLIWKTKEEFVLKTCTNAKEEEVRCRDRQATKKEAKNKKLPKHPFKAAKWTQNKKCK